VRPFIIGLYGSCEATNKKYARDYRRRKREEAAAQISMLDSEMLELARRLREFPWCWAARASFVGVAEGNR
jgi:hypothetical protein